MTKPQALPDGFSGALGTNYHNDKPRLVDDRFVKSELDAAFRAIQRLESYEVFVAHTREKTKVSSRSVAFENFVVAQADRAELDCEIVSDKVLAVGQHLAM